MNLIYQIITSCFKFQKLQCQWLCFQVGATLGKGVGKDLLFIATLHRIVLGFYLTKGLTLIILFWSSTHVPFHRLSQYVSYADSSCAYKVLEHLKSRQLRHSYKETMEERR